MSEVTKRCSKCKLYKPLSEFHKDSSSSDGLYSQCKVCKNGYAREYQSRPEVIAREKLPEVRKRRSVSEAKWRRNNPDYQRKYRSDPVVKERIKEYHRNWERNKINNNQLAAIRGRISHRIRELLKHMGKRKDRKTVDIIGCSYEEFVERVGPKRKGYELDHIIPVSLAETKEEVFALNHWSNFQWLPKKANRQKSDTLPSIFLLRPETKPLAFQVYMRNV